VADTIGSRLVEGYNPKLEKQIEPSDLVRVFSQVQPDFYILFLVFLAGTLGIEPNHKNLEFLSPNLGTLAPKSKLKVRRLGVAPSQRRLSDAKGV